MPDASGHMAAAPGVCCYLFVLVCEIEFLAVIVRIRHTFQLGKGLLGQRPHIPVHTRHGCGDLAYRPASVCVVVHTDQIFFFHGKVHHSSYLQFIFLGSGRRLFRAGGLFAVGKLLADRWPGLANTHITALIFVNHGMENMINQIEDQQELMAEMYQEMEQRDGQLILFQEKNQRLQELNNELQEQLQILPSIEELLELLEKKDGEVQTLKEENRMLKDENQQWKELTEKLNDENRLLQRQNEELLNYRTD